MGSNLPHISRPGTGGGGERRSVSPQQGAQETAKRLGLTCFHAGQHVPGLGGCVGAPGHGFSNQCGSAAAAEAAGADILTLWRKIWKPC